MEKKEKATKLTKTEKKVSTGLVFIASLFFTVVVLLYSGKIILVTIAGVLMMGAAYLFLNAIFEEKTEEWDKLTEEELALDVEALLEPESEEKISEKEMYQNIMQQMEAMDRTNKAIFSVLKRSEEKADSQIRRLERALERVVTQHASDHKELVKYNKENARQMAISERETLEHVLQELKKAIEERPVAIQTMPEVSAEESEYEESGYEEPAYEEPVYEEPVYDEPVPEIESEPEVAPTEIDLSTTAGVDLTDPNATLTPEDIAKLFAAAGN